MYKAENCFSGKDHNGNIVFYVEVTGEDREGMHAKFGSRFYEDTQERIESALNGKYYKLPFGIRILKN